MIGGRGDLQPQLHKDMLIVLESTTFPGSTREVLLPKLAGVGAQGRRGLLPRLLARARRSGQREVSHQEHAQGRRRHHAALPRGDPGHVRRRSSTRWCRCRRTDAAEMVKLLENTFRAVNIGLVNEMAIMCHKLGHRHLGGDRRGGDQAVRLHAVLSRARASAGTASRSIRSTCRGSCKTLKYEARFIELADDDQHRACRDYVVEKVAGRAQRRRRRRSTARRSWSLGVAYKRDIDDVRESPALDIIELLQAARAPRSATTTRTAATVQHRRAHAASRWRFDKLDSYDCVVDRHRPHDGRLQAGGAPRPRSSSTRATRMKNVKADARAKIVRSRPNRRVAWAVYAAPRSCSARAPAVSLARARARAERSAYSVAEAFSTAVRFVRVDRGCKVDRQGRRRGVRDVRVQRRGQGAARLARDVQRSAADGVRCRSRSATRRTAWSCAGSSCSSASCARSAAPAACRRPRPRRRPSRRRRTAACRDRDRQDEQATGDRQQATGNARRRRRLASVGDTARSANCRFPVAGCLLTWRLVVGDGARLALPWRIRRRCRRCGCGVTGHWPDASSASAVWRRARPR